MGFAWSVPVSSKENNRAKTNGGGKRMMGGIQSRFWEGVLWYVFPSHEFSTPPLFFSEIPQKESQRLSAARKIARLSGWES